MDVELPIAQVLNAATMLQALVFAGILFSALHKEARLDYGRAFLVAALVILATIKADEIYQMSGGLRRWPSAGFVLAPFQALMTPLLYLFVSARTRPDFQLRGAHAAHALPMLLFTLYLWAIYWRFPESQKINLIASGDLGAAMNRIVTPLVGDAIQLGYIAAALHRLERYGVSLRDWFSEITNRDMRGVKWLLSLWAAVFLAHATWIAFGGLFQNPQLAHGLLVILDVSHFIFVQALFMIGLNHRTANEINHEIAGGDAAKYARSTLNDDARQALFHVASDRLKADRLYLRQDLTLSELADACAATPRELSEAINGVGKRNFHRFVNEARIAHARRLLAAQPDAKVLDIALQSGFNSKTAFNEAFRTIAGTTPTTFRRTAAAPCQSAASQATKTRI